MRRPWRRVGTVLRCRLDVRIAWAREPEVPRAPAEAVLALLDAAGAPEAVQAVMEARHD